MGFVQTPKNPIAMAPSTSVATIDASGRTIGGHSRPNRMPNTGHIEKMTKEIVANTLWGSEVPTNGVGKIVRPIVASAPRKINTLAGLANTVNFRATRMSMSAPRIKKLDWRYLTGDSGEANSLMVWTTGS